MSEDLLQKLEGVAGGGMRLYRVAFTPNGTSDPASFSGAYVASVTYLASNMWKVTFNSTIGTILSFGWAVQSNSGGPAQGFHFELDNANTNMTPTSGGSQVAIASVNASGSRATIANDANTKLFFTFIVGKDPTNQ